ncbi:MAG: RNA methyltransferase [Chloroflexi bacterium]|nr:RNA methyltransferase [Chloroflexota bacterium]
MASEEQREEVFRQLLHQGVLTHEDKPFWDLLTWARLQKMLTVLRHRTKHIVVGMEAVDDGHNQAAILRSADAFGVQEVAVVTGRGGFAPSERVTQGAHKWLTIRHYPDIQEAMESLKARGYVIWASRLDPQAVPLDRVDLSRPAAFFFGNEHAGLSPDALALADRTFVIPMVGFAQSLNVSVAAAITLYQSTHRARELLGDAYFLSPQEQGALFRRWLRIATPSVRRMASLEGRNT